MFKLLCVALLPLIGAEYLYGDVPYNYNTAYASGYDNYKPRDYKFEYGVSDPHTGDHKSQWEVRENGVVRGAYSLLEADGTTRVVEYYADDTGFHADVKKIGTAIHDSPDHGITPIIKTQVADSIAYNGYGHGGLEHNYGAPIAAIQHAAPIAISHETPITIAHEAPIAKVESIAPVQQLIAPQIHTIQEYAQVPIEKFAPIHKYEQVIPIQKYVPEIVQPVQKYAYDVAPVQHGHYIQEVVKSAPQIHQIPTEYIQQAPQQHYIQQAPQQHYIQQAPQTHYIQEQYSHEVPHYVPQQPHYIQEVVKQAPVPVQYTQQVQQPHYIQEVVKQAPVPVQYAAPLPLPKYNQIPAPHYSNQIAIENYAQPQTYIQAPIHAEQKVSKIQDDFYSDAGIYYQPAKPELAAYHNPSPYTYAGH